MSTTASQVTGVSIVYSSVGLGADKRKTSKLSVTGLCAGNSPVTRKIFPFDDVIMLALKFYSSPAQVNANYFWPSVAYKGNWKQRLFSSVAVKNLGCTSSMSDNEIREIMGNRHHDHDDDHDDDDHHHYHQHLYHTITIIICQLSWKKKFWFWAFFISFGTCILFHILDPLRLSVIGQISTL